MKALYIGHMYSCISVKFCLENFDHKISTLFKLRTVTLPKACDNKMYLAVPFYEHRKREPNFAIVFKLRAFKSDKAIFSYHNSNRVFLELN